MPNLPPKTEIGRIACGACGKSVVVRLNKNGNAYYFCNHSDDDGQSCAHHQRWGKVASQQMQRAYLEHAKSAKKETDNEQPDPARSDDKRRAKEPAAAKQDGGFLYG